MMQTQSWQPSPMPPRVILPRYVQAVNARGRVYYYFRHGVYRARLDGDPGSSEFHADYARRLLGVTGQDPKPAKHKAGSVGAMIEAYRQSPQFTTLATKTRTSYERELLRLQPLLPFEVTAVRRRHLNAIRDQLADKPRTRQLFGAVCSKLWNYGITELDIDVINPARMMRRDGEAESYLAWTDDQMAAFDASCPPCHLRTAYMIARYIGPRRGDLVALMRSDYDGQRIRIAGHKTKTPAVVPAHPMLRAYLDQLPAALYLVADAEGRPVTANRLSKDLRAHLDGIGLSGLSLHGLRHTAATALADAGCSAHQIAAVLGHRTLQMVQRYTQAAEQEALATAAIGKLTVDKNRTG